MKFIIQTETLKNISKILLRVISKNIPGSSSDIMIKVSQDSVTFKTRQFDFNIVCTAETSEQSGTGVVFVPVQVLDGVVSSLVDALTVFEISENKLLVNTKTSSSEIYIISNEDEDEVMITEPETDPSSVIEREVLVSGFKNVRHAAAESVIKPEIASVYMYTKNNSMYFVSTDALRLTEVRFLLNSPPADDISVLIPIKNVDKILKVFESISDDDIRIYVNDNNVYFATKTILIKTNSVKGTFPDYKSTIPTDFDMSLTILKSDMVNFLKKASLFSDKLNKISFTVQNETTLDLDFKNEIVGTTRNTIPVVVKGEVIKPASFNYRFIHDTLSVISDDRVMFNFIEDRSKPLMIRGADNTALTSIVAPLIERE